METSVTCAKDSSKLNPQKGAIKSTNEYLRNIKISTSAHPNRDADDEDIKVNNSSTHYGNNDSSSLSASSTESLETASDEIPIWIHGADQLRWVSGINEETTCGDVINVLLTDMGSYLLGNSYHPCLDERNHHHHLHNLERSSSSGRSPIGGNNWSNTRRNFVITERWRRMEQILGEDERILQIWSAWGHEKSEVKLTLRQLDPIRSTEHACINAGNNNNFEKDSGMGSPNGSSNSAIIRRRRHKASKSSPAWVTHAQTIHPKSQRATIEKLMKLILEQGETIQQQLAKLRDRELQITKIEEERHKIREKEHGKNYLLETYLNGLHEAAAEVTNDVEAEKEVITGNSDSGVHTEGALSSPEISSYHQEDDEDCSPEGKRLSKITTTRRKYNDGRDGERKKQNYKDDLKGDDVGYVGSSLYREKSSHREKKLLKEHKHTKKFSSLLNENNSLEASEGDDNQVGKGKTENDLMRKSEKSRTLHGQNLEVNKSKEEQKQVGCHINKSNNTLPAKSDLSAKIEWMEKLVIINKHLQREEELLVRLGAKIRKYESENPSLNENEIHEALVKVNENINTRNNEMKKLDDDLILSSNQLKEKKSLLEVLHKELSELEENDGNEKFHLLQNGHSKLEMNGGNLVENLFNFSQYILKPNYEFNEINENHPDSMKLFSEWNKTTLPPAVQQLETTIQAVQLQEIPTTMAPGKLIPSPNSAAAYPPLLPFLQSELKLKNSEQQIYSTHMMPTNNPLNSISVKDGKNENLNFNKISAGGGISQDLTKNFILSQNDNSYLFNCNESVDYFRKKISEAPIVNCKSSANSIVNSIYAKGPTGGTDSIVDSIDKNFPSTQVGVTSAPFNSTSVTSFLHQPELYALQKDSYLMNSNGGTENEDVALTGTSTYASKLLSKKFVANRICNEFESNSDTGMSSMSEDVTQIGTLV